jgi:nucleotide-binding universal stress UspA family protein
MQTLKNLHVRGAMIRPAQEVAMVWHTMIVGVDGSPESVEAAALGAFLAERAGVECRLVHAVPDYWTGLALPEIPVDPEALAAAAREHARTVVSHALEGAVPTALIAALDVRDGRSAYVLDDAAREAHASVVVLGGKRRRALARLGSSTVTHLVRLGTVPVLATDGVASDIRRVLVAADLSYAAKPAIETAQRWAALLGAQLRVLHVVEPVPVVPGITLGVADDDVFLSCERAVDAEIKPLVTAPGADIVIRRGRAAAAITSEARQWRADLIVLGSHGRGWVDRLLIGSVSERLLNVLPASILVVPVAHPTAQAPVVERGAILKQMATG